MECPYEIYSGIDIDNFSQDTVAIRVVGEGSPMVSFPKIK
jgi:hypothetical protein